MNIFHNRPLALISFVAIFSSLCAHKIPTPLKIAVIIIALAVFIFAIAVSRKSDKRRFAALLVSLCALSAALSASVQLFAIDMRAERARSFEGEHRCELLIIEAREVGGDSYSAILRDVDGEQVDFDANLYLSFGADLEAGDIVRVSGDVTRTGSVGGLYADGAELDVFVYGEEYCVLVSEENFSLRILFENMRNLCARYMERCFGEECGALARGIFLGDTDGIDRTLIRDFRRSGVSHLLAVSGLHISMLVAMVELILIKASVPRRVRCVIISLLSLFFLGMTGFAMSACRSVLMLLFVYLHYLFARESDSLTALFAVVALIMLLSPSAVLDVGLWLSFLATLGIISVYSPASRYLRLPRKRGFLRGVLRILRAAAMAIMISFVCNVFTALVVWGVFGELSAVTLISNLVLTPLSILFLLTIPIGMLTADLGFIGDAVVSAIRAISELTEYMCGVFSRIDGAVISLRYGFAGAIVILMSAALAVMLVIKMKRKMFILIPPIAAVAAFAICLSVHNAINEGNLDIAYRREHSNEMLMISERYSAAVIDISSGSQRFLGGVGALAKERYATEISDLVLTHYHDAHPDSIRLICERVMLRRVYLPTPRDEDEWRIAKEIAEVARLYGCDTVEYESGETLVLLSDTRVRIDRGGACNVAVLTANDEDALVYLGDGVRESEGAESLEALVDHVILGAHGAKSTLGRERDERINFTLH